MCQTIPPCYIDEQDPIRDMWWDTRWYLEYSPEITLVGLEAYLKERHRLFLPKKLRQIAQEALPLLKEKDEIADRRIKVCEKILELIPA